MDCKRQRERYNHVDPPHGVVLGHMLERLNDLAVAEGQPVLVIADELHEDDRFRKELHDYRRYGTPGYLSSTLPQVLDTLHFAPSNRSRLLQAADMITFLHHRRETRQDKDPRAQKANDLLWSRIAPNIQHQRTWTP